MQRVLLLGAACLLFCACEEEQAPAEAKAEPAAAEPAAPAPMEKSAEEKAAEEKKAEREKEKAEMDADPLTQCCRALGTLGFNERSQEYMGASQECGTAMTEKKSLPDALAAINKALKGKELPKECQ